MDPDVVREALEARLERAYWRARRRRALAGAVPVAIAFGAVRQWPPLAWMAGLGVGYFAALAIAFGVLEVRAARKAARLPPLDASWLPTRGTGRDRARSTFARRLGLLAAWVTRPAAR